jgi:hypothetical protein
MMSMRRPALALLLAVASSGCLRSTTTIDLRPDGSGTILQETGMTAQALAMLKGFSGASQETGRKDSKGPELFSEEQARKAADTMGVTFVSGEPFKDGGLEGYRARYAFEDITKIKVKLDQGSSSMSGDSRQPPFGFTLDRGAASSVLTIQMPEQAPGAALPGLPAAGGSDAEKAQAAQALAMMKMMMQGMFVDVSLNVSGRILKSNAPHIDGSRVTLLQIDLDKIMADDGALQKLQSATDLKALSSVPGLKVASEPKLTIEFSR